MKNRKETANRKYTYGHVTVDLSNPSKPTRARGEIMAFSDSSEAICSVSSISISSYSGGESTKSETLPEGNSVVLLLDKLRSPVLSELARKKKVSTNPPPVGQKRSKGGSACRRKEREEYGGRGRGMEGEGGVWREREEYGGRGRSMEGEGGVRREREEYGERGRSMEGEGGVWRERQGYGG